MILCLFENAVFGFPVEVAESVLNVEVIVTMLRC